MATRREVLKQVFKGAGYLTVGGLAWGGLLKGSKANEFVLRPPAAIDESDFTKACIKCGLCVEACPYDTLELATSGSAIGVGTPYFNAREIPCYMCIDVPCVPPCPTGALDINLLVNSETDKMDINKAQMGLAVINEDTCVAFDGTQCDACYRVCPVLDEAIFIETKRNERTGKHAYLVPKVSADACTGCGLCEHACITEVPAIKIFPREMVMGKKGSHYISWDETDKQRLNELKKVEKYEQDNSSTIDYLNNSDDIFSDD